MAEHHGISLVAPFHAVVGFLEKFGVNTVVPLLVIGLGMIWALFFYFDINSNKVLAYAIATSPIWLPVVLFKLFFDTWLFYVRNDFDLKQGRVSLEIKLPAEIYKSPAAMEVVLTQLYQTASPDNHFQTYIDGKHPPVFGLEIVSTEGAVRFIVNVPRKKFKNMIETFLYAQYPGIEITELPIDYTAAIRWDPSEFEVFALHFGLKKPDPYPIKTYIDYGLDEDPKEELKIDPIQPMIEFLGSIGPGENIWVQILISAHRKEEFKTGSLTTRPDWTKAVTAEINKLTGREKKEDAFTALKLTDGERDLIKALERSRGKYAFNTYVRSLYAAKKKNYMPGERIGLMITTLFPFHDLNRNTMSFKWRTDFDWNMWQDPTGKKRLHLKKEELMDYKLRRYTGRTPKDQGSILTTEEIATMFHLPGSAITTPTLSRIPSTRSEAPTNLPTG